MGKHYVLADEMYASNFDASSFISHQYIIAGQARLGGELSLTSVGLFRRRAATISSTVTKQRQYGSYIPVCWDDDDAGRRDGQRRPLVGVLRLRDRFGDGGHLERVSEHQSHLQRSRLEAKTSSRRRRSSSTTSRNGKLRDVTWITPTCANSDHAGCGTKTGPAWVASLVNAIGKSKYWDSTAIFIFWDDYGGWYDPKPPAWSITTGSGCASRC